MANTDKRRPDERVPVNSEPFWFSSAIIDYANANASDTDVLKSFQAADGTYLILAAACEVITAFDGSASFIAGVGTMATNALGTVTAVDADQMLISTDVTEGTIGLYTQVGSQFGTDLGAGKATVIKGADATVPVLYATVTATAATVGKARFHFLMTRVPVQ